MWSRLVLFVALVISLGKADGADSWTVTIEQGPIRGYRAPEGDLFVFYNIPYATAPKGKDKFKAPLPAPVWDSPREALDLEVKCPQQKIVKGDNNVYQEDCLIANVYVPDTHDKNLPVVFIVHGDTYLMGFGDLFTPKQIVRSKTIIAVTFNYRLGAHGFLCLGTADVPGNAGMKDIVAALRWVHNNIASFGGNPGDVTIQGYGAGSSAVDLLLLSKTTKGLFHKAIPESGANVAMWSVQLDPLGTAKSFARSQGFNDIDDLYALEDFYKTASYDMLSEKNYENIMQKDNDFVFTPCVERDTGVERFLDDYPVNILRKGDYNKVPMLYGFSNMEGLFRVLYGYEDIMEEINKKFFDYLPRDLKFSNEKEKKRIAKEVKEFYFGKKKIDNYTVLQYIDYYTDILFAYPTLRSLKLQVKAGNDKIYLYQYSFPYLSEQTPLPAGVENVEGANHCSQSLTVFDGYPGYITKDETHTPEDVKEITSITRQFWLNFITKGSPVPKGSLLPTWPPANAHGSPYMEIDLPPALGSDLLGRRARFWDRIYEQHYRAPIPPPKPTTKRTEL